MAKVSETQEHTVHLQDNFYRDNYFRVLLILGLLILINVGLGGVIYYQSTLKPIPQYFGMTADDRIIPTYPLTDPVIESSSLLQWTNQTILGSFNYDYKDYVKRLKLSSVKFTPKGWDEFQSVLKKVGNLKLLVDKMLVSRAVPTGAPVIRDQGILNNRYAWKVQMPLTIYYDGLDDSYSRHVEVTVLVTRVSNLSEPRGVAISQFTVVESP